MRQEKKEEEELLALKITWMHIYEDSKMTLKRTKKDLLQRPVTANNWPNRTTITMKMEKRQRHGFFIF